MGEEQRYTRPENLLQSLGIDFRGLTEEEREMKKLLVEKYKKHQKNLINEIKKWREAHLEATLGDSIQALYQEAGEE